MSKRGRPEYFSSGRNLIEALEKIEHGDVEDISYYHRQQLTDLGFAEQFSEERHQGQRGRSRKLFKVSRQGRNVLSNATSVFRNSAVKKTA